MTKLQIILGCIFFAAIFYILPSAYSVSTPPIHSQCPEKPHYVWGMIPQSKLDAPPCRLVKAYGKFTVIFEGEDGQVFVAHGNHITIPDETHSSLRFIDWQNYRHLEEKYDAVVTSLIRPYCLGHGEATAAAPKGATTEFGGWSNYYPIIVKCSDGTRVIISDKLLQSTQDTSHTKE